MWQESTAGVADLACTDLLANDLAAVGVNTKQWARKGITLSSDFLDREELFRIADRARTEASDAVWLQLFWDVLAWGVMGNFRNAGRIIDFAATDEGRAQLLRALRAAAVESYAGRIENAYRAFVEHKVPRLGPAFFTKILFFTGNRMSSDPQCLIFDSRVESALPTVTGVTYSLARTPVTTYAQYCRDVYEWSRAYDVSPEVIEARLYQLGRETGSSRRAWLSAEVSLYREGRTPVTFDAILTRLRDQRGA